MDEMTYVRRIDHVGRILLPKEIRAKMDLMADRDAVEFFVDGDRVIIKKYDPVIPSLEK